MSQAKVNRYKEEKANRKQIIAKQKMQKAVASICGVVAALGILGGVVFSGYQYYEKNKPAKTITVDVSSIDNYMEGVIAE